MTTSPDNINISVTGNRTPVGTTCDTKNSVGVMTQNDKTLGHFPAEAQNESTSSRVSSKACDLVSVRIESEQAQRKDETKTERLQADESADEVDKSAVILVPSLNTSQHLERLEINVGKGQHEEALIIGDLHAGNDATGVQDEAEEPVITLTDLPTEVFLQVCSYLSARFLMQTCRLVCKRLYGILSDDFIWRSRIYKRWSQVYPPVPAEQQFVDWKAACINLEEQQERWSNMQSAMKHVSWKDIHFASIDAIMLINKGTLCVSGSRDRSMAVWNVATRDPQPLVHIGAHRGWIWDLATKSDSSFYSCSWDNTAKLWTLEEGRLTCINTYKCKSAVLSVVCSPRLLALGSHDKRILLYDPRSGETPIHTYTAHRRAVLRLSLLAENDDDSCIVSISEDQTLAVWDLRACKLFKENVKVGSPERNAFPLCMSLTTDMLYIGDTRGQLHLVDPRRDSPTGFQVLASYDAGHRDQCKITAVRHGLGCVITGSSDGTVRVSTPTHHPEFITSFRTIGSEVACMDFQHGTLAVGCTNCAVELWAPDHDVSP